MKKKGSIAIICLLVLSLAANIGLAFFVVSLASRVDQNEQKLTHAEQFIPSPTPTADEIHREFSYSLEGMTDEEIVDECKYYFEFLDSDHGSTNEKCFDEFKKILKKQPINENRVVVESTQDMPKRPAVLTDNIYSFWSGDDLDTGDTVLTENDVLSEIRVGGDDMSITLFITDETKANSVFELLCKYLRKDYNRPFTMDTDGETQYASAESDRVFLDSFVSNRFIVVSKRKINGVFAIESYRKKESDLSPIWG